MRMAAPSSPNPTVRSRAAPVSLPFASDTAPSTTAMSPGAPGTIPAATPLVVQFAASFQSPEAPPAQRKSRIASPSSVHPEKPENRPLPENETSSTPPPDFGGDMRNHVVPSRSESRT